MFETVNIATSYATGPFTAERILTGHGERGWLLGEGSPCVRARNSPHRTVDANILMSVLDLVLSIAMSL